MSEGTMKFSMTAAGLVLGAALVVGAATPPAFQVSPAHAKDWWPYTVDVWPGLEMRQRRKLVEYEPLAKASKKWNLCVSVPRMNNPFWDAINYGLVSECRRVGVRMELFDAGGYTEEANQATQIRACVDGGADAVIVAGISPDGLNPLVSELRAKGIPVINMANEVLSEEISAKSLVSFGERAWYLAEYLVKRHPEGTEKVKVAWLPDAGEPGWVFSQHFNEEIAHGAIEVVEPGGAINVGPIEDIVANHPDLRYIAGNPLFAHGAIRHLTEIGRLGEIKVLTYDTPPSVYQAIKDGEMLAATTDSPTIQARVAVDQAVRLLEGEDFLLHVGPYHYMVDTDNLNTTDRSALLAPEGFVPVFKVE
ncbi:MAG: TMAO reductase system periplasmic protein TorT [Alphaproteobacteria bacterium]|nr:TMAO reductase system periplasmic protein TorT [Alphaproteobacteria bacterium]